jgi:hypothetical protein
LIETFVLHLSDTAVSQVAKHIQDALPFVSTFQGVSRAHGKWWYTVRPVLNSDNQKAGSRLGAWLTANHILAGDTYWVAIER